MTLFTSRYGSGPLHLLGHLGCFALALWAASHLIDARNALNIAFWFVGALILHDALFLPAYAMLDRLAGTVTPLRTLGLVNFVRVPIALSGLLLLIYLPTILGRNQGSFAAVSGITLDAKVGTWLLVSALFFVVAAVACALTARGRAARLAPALGPRDLRPRGW